MAFPALNLKWLCLLSLPAFLVPCSPGRASASGADPELRIIQKHRAQFPIRLQRQGVMNGEVRMFIEVDNSGELLDCLIVAFTHQAFANEAFQAVRSWEFEIPAAGPHRVNMVAPVTFTFEHAGVLVRERFGPDELDYRNVRFVYSPVRANELDRPPKPLVSVSPKYPKALSDEGIKGVVTLEFFIDEKGKIRMPRPVGNAHPLLAGLAAEALRLWEFEPPLRRGRPVLVLARSDFKFVPGESEPRAN